MRALEAEAESLRKLNPFLVLGVGYETTDADVRAAFGELTKRYHPDRFARYQSTQLRQIAAEIFILIRDAYRKLADEQSRAAGARDAQAGHAARAPQPPPSARRRRSRCRARRRRRRCRGSPCPRRSRRRRPHRRHADVPRRRPRSPHDAPTNPSAKTAAARAHRAREAPSRSRECRVDAQPDAAQSVPVESARRPRRSRSSTDDERRAADRDPPRRPRRCRPAPQGRQRQRGARGAARSGQARRGARRLPRGVEEESAAIASCAPASSSSRA